MGNCRQTTPPKRGGRSYGPISEKFVVIAVLSAMLHHYILFVFVCMYVCR